MAVPENVIRMLGMTEDRDAFYCHLRASGIKPNVLELERSHWGAELSRASQILAAEDETAKLISPHDGYLLALNRYREPQVAQAANVPLGDMYAADDMRPWIVRVLWP